MKKLLLASFLTLMGIPVLAQVPDTISFNETWLFKMYRSANVVPQNVMSANFDDSQWTFQMMPAQWRAIPQKWAKDNVVGVYRGWVKLLPEWANKSTRVMLHVGNSTAPMDIYVNGFKVGITSKYYATMEYDITKYLKKGRNLYTFIMSRWEKGETALLPGIISPSFIYRLKNGAEPVLSKIPDEVKNGKVKGIPVRIIDRLSVEPPTGWVESPKHTQRTIDLIKQLNYNAVAYNKASSENSFMEACENNGIAVVRAEAPTQECFIDERGQFTDAGLRALHQTQLLEAKLVDASHVQVKISNKDVYKDFKGLDLIWQLYANGHVIDHGSIPADLAHLSSREYAISCKQDEVPVNEELILKMIYQDHKSGDVFGYDLLDLRPYNASDAIVKGEAKTQQYSEMRKPKLIDKEMLEVTCDDYTVTFDKATGYLTKYTLFNHHYLTGIRPAVSCHLNNITVSKPDKKKPTVVVVHYKGDGDTRDFTMTYSISLSGVLTVSITNNTSIQLDYTPYMDQLEYYAKGDITPIYSRKYNSMVADVKWWEQMEASGYGVRLISKEGFGIIPGKTKTQMTIVPTVKNFALNLFRR